jgi:hypothetical protein
MNIPESITNIIPKSAMELKIFHHRHGSNVVYSNGYFENRKIKISEDLVVIQVNDEFAKDSSLVNKIPFEKSSSSVQVVIPKYEKWTSKPKELIKYIEEHYEELPEYILYVDGSDVVIINDILDPKSMLDYYKCDVLFNCEPNYAHTGFDKPSLEFYYPLYDIHKKIYTQLSFEKYGIVGEKGLNAGVFLGKKSYVLEMLKEAYAYMIDDHTKGFPYGSLDDQCILRYIQILHFDKIACDVFNKYFLFAFPKCMEVSEDNWEHFEYYKKFIHTYENKNESSSNFNNNTFETSK